MPNLPTFSRRRETSMRAPLIRSVLDLIPSLSLCIHSGFCLPASRMAAVMARLPRLDRLNQGLWT
jgi:hypothetical protein